MEAAEGLYCGITLQSEAWTGQLTATELSASGSCFFALSTLQKASCGELSDDKSRFILACPEERTLESNDMNSVLAVEVAGEVKRLEPHGKIQDLAIFTVEIPVDILPGHIPALEAMHVNLGEHGLLIEGFWDSVGVSRFTLPKPFGETVTSFSGQTRQDLYKSAGGDCVTNDSGQCRDFYNQRQTDKGEGDTDGDGASDVYEVDRGTDKEVYDHFYRADDDHDDVPNLYDNDIDGDSDPNETDPDIDNDGYDNSQDADSMDSESGPVEEGQQPKPMPHEEEGTPNPMDDGFGGFISVHTALSGSDPAINPPPNGDTGPVVKFVNVGRMWAVRPSEDGTGGLAIGGATGTSLTDVPIADLLPWPIEPAPMP